MQIKGRTPRIGKLQEIRETWPSTVSCFDLPPPPPSAKDVRHPNPEDPTHRPKSHKKSKSIFTDEATQREEYHPPSRWTQILHTEQIEKRTIPEILCRNKIHPNLPPSLTTSGRNSCRRRKNSTSSTPQRARTVAFPPQQTLAPPSNPDGEQTLGLDRLLPTLYTSA